MKTSRRHGAARLAFIGLCMSVLTFGASQASANGVFQAADVFEFFGETPTGALPENPALTGAAWLKRTPNRIQGRIMTKVAQAGLAHTVWVVIFNNPEYCVDGCNGDDAFGVPEVEAAVYYGTAAISALSPPGGVINVDLAIRDDGLPEGIFSLDEAIGAEILADGLSEGNGMCAEIHLVVDDHLGPVKTDAVSWVKDLTTTDFPVPEFQVTPILGASNHRAAVFLPPPGCQTPD